LESTVPENRCMSCCTMPICLRSDCSVYLRISVPSMRMTPERGS
jgi:hypothetical protein